MEERLEPAGDGLIRVKGCIRFALSQHFGDPSAWVDTSLSYRFVEEGGNGEEAELRIVAPPGFEAREEKPYVYRGELTHERASFDFESVPYPADWTGRIKGDVSFTNDMEVNA